MENIILYAGLSGLLLGGFGYFYSRSANAFFLLSLVMIGYGAVLQMKATGEIHDLSTGIGETTFGEFGRKLGWSVEIFERLAANVQTAIFVFIGAFFIARIIAWVARANSPERQESQRRRRKRVLKSFGMKNMADLRRRY